MEKTCSYSLIHGRSYEVNHIKIKLLLWKTVLFLCFELVLKSSVLLKNRSQIYIFTASTYTHFTQNGSLQRNHFRKLM